MPAKCLFILSLICKKKKNKVNAVTTDTQEKTITQTEMTCGSKRATREMCYRCTSVPYTYIREFDYKLLPAEYFHLPDDNTLNIMKTQGLSEMETYPEYWIHLPREFVLSKYPYKVCDECYDAIKDNQTHVWNTWNQVHVSTKIN